MTRNRIYTDPDLLDVRRSVTVLYWLVAAQGVAIIVLAIAALTG